MDKFGDIQLFVKIVKHQGLASAGRELGLSPASTTARLNRLEENYGVRLLNRTTRSVALTEEGRTFYESCIKILTDVKQAEERLTTGKSSLAGYLKISTTNDLGRTEIAPLIEKYTKQNPDMHVHLSMKDTLVNLIDGNFDLAIRYGSMPDSGVIARKLATNKRLLCASPKYLKKYGEPEDPEEVTRHKCLAMVQSEQQVRRWYFHKGGKQTSYLANIVMSSDDGGQIKKWALTGQGIALKSYWDIRQELASGKLVQLFNEYDVDFVSHGQSYDANLYAVYLSRDFLPERTRVFINTLIDHFKNLPKPPADL